MRDELVTFNVGVGGMSELHYAAYCQDLPRVQVCVQAGMDVNQKDDSGYTPLAWCVDMALTSQQGVAESIFDYLVQHGATLDFSNDTWKSLLELARNSDDAIADHLEGYLNK